MDLKLCFQKSTWTRRQSSSLTRQGRRTMTLDDLHEDILVEILIRLPSKSAFQCKSVSKRWYSIISTSYFTNRFYVLNPSFTLLIQRSFYSIHVVPTDPKLKSLISFKFKEIVNKPFIIQASCNDLLLCTYSNWPVIDRFHMIYYYVVNPIAHTCVGLPPVTLLGTGYRIGFIYRYGNHDQLIYRVVLIPPFSDKLKETKVEIFASETGKWSNSVLPCPGNFDRRGVPYKNLLFWWDSEGGRLIWFDPYNSDCCGFFEHPEKLDPFQGHVIKDPLGVCHGCLRLCQFLKNPQEGLRLWEIKDYDDKGGKWYLEHEMYFNEMVSPKCPQLLQHIDRSSHPMLAYHPKDKDIIYLILIFWAFPGSEQRMVISCNMRTKTLEVIHDTQSIFYFPHHLRTRHLFEVFTFVHPPVLSLL